MRTPARVIFFDLGETLVTQNIEDNLVTKHALEELSRILPRHVSGKRLYQTYRKGYEANHAIRSRHHVEIPVHTWMSELLLNALGEAPSEDLVDSAIKIIVRNRAANSIAFRDAKPTLDMLAKRSTRLGIISNVSSHEVALQILKHVSLDHYFEHVITSALTGVRKPDAGIFLFALNKFGAKPELAVHVGDSEVHDIRGARPVGITSILVKDSRRPLRSDADYVFPNLKEAAATLETLTTG